MNLKITGRCRAFYQLQNANRTTTRQTTREEKESAMCSKNQLHGRKKYDGGRNLL